MVRVVNQRAKETLLRMKADEMASYAEAHTPEPDTNNKFSVMHGHVLRTGIIENFQLTFM